MSQKATTKDELFLMKLYQMALNLGDPQEEVDLLAVGRAIGQNDKGTLTICRLLAQANFVKKGKEETTLFLTKNGIILAEQLLELHSPGFIKGK